MRVTRRPAVRHSKPLRVHLRIYEASDRHRQVGSTLPHWGSGALRWLRRGQTHVRPPAVRGQGVARAILDRIEAETRAANLPVLRLETGDRQADALRLYRRYRFTDCPPFGDDATLPPHRRFFQG